MNLMNELKIFYEAFYASCNHYQSFWKDVNTHIQAIYEFVSLNKFLSQKELDIHWGEVIGYAEKNRTYTARNIYGKDYQANEEAVEVSSERLDNIHDLINQLIDLPLAEYEQLCKLTSPQDTYKKFEVAISNLYNTSQNLSAEFKPVSYDIDELYNFAKQQKYLNKATLKIHKDNLSRFKLPKTTQREKSRKIKNASSLLREARKNINNILELEEETYDSLFKKECSNSASENLLEIPTTKIDCVFIGHGRSPLWAKVNTMLSDELELKTIYFEREPQTGKSIIPILEGFLEKATFAVLVMTAEDETASNTIRARQNVVHEAGLFQGRLGFDKVVILKQEGLEKFSNVDGLQYIPFSKDNIEQTFYELQRTLKRKGIIE